MTPLPIQAQLFPQIYYWGVFIACLFLYFNYSGSDNCNKLLQKNSMAPALVFSVLLIVFIGMRPLSYMFGDSANYAHGYAFDPINAVFSVDLSKEWFWRFLRDTCRVMGGTVHFWFFIIAVVYISFPLIGFRKLVGENAWMAMLFFLSAFSTYQFGVNGLRNGFACSMVILAFAIAANGNISKMLLGGVVIIFAMGSHKSVMLPLAAFLAATYVIKSPKWAIYFWIASIGVSLVAGGTMVNFFSGLGFDDRMAAYGNSMDQYTDSFSSTGFRWDFLAYSAMPVWLTWYVTKKAEKERSMYGDTVEEAETNITGAGRIADAHSMRVFNILATTYILANSFWVMVIKAAFSNRFAYLSWFLYPVVLAYAVIRLHIWPDQDRKAGLILLLHAGFTIIMFMLGKA